MGAVGSTGSRVGVAVVVGVLVGGAAPRVTALRDHPAGAAFEFVPPAGFVESEQAKGALDGHVTGGQKVWVRPSLEVLAGGYTPNVSLVRTPKTAPVEESELVALAHGMPQTFGAAGSAWAELRHGVHRRPDGGRVGFIEGSARALAGGESHRVLQIAFPVDDGTAIVTASFPELGADRDEQDFEASIDAAKGVAFRAPPPPMNAYLAWGLGAGALTYMIAAFLASREAARPKTSAA